MKWWVGSSDRRYAIVNDQGEETAKDIGGVVTGNQIGYLAMLDCLARCAEDDEVFCSSELVVRQLKGDYNVHEPKLFQLYDRCLRLMLTKWISITWVPGKGNPAGRLLGMSKGIE